MTKRSKITLFGLLALIAAFGLVLTGCPDAAGSGGDGDGYTPPTAVKLATGSHGTAGSEKIAGLVVASKYVVYDTYAKLWYGVKTDGTLGTGVASPTTAATSAAGLDAEVTTIASPLLVNGRTYNVYEYFSTGLTTSNTIKKESGTVSTGGKNVMVVSAIANTYAFAIHADAAANGGSIVVLTSGALKVNLSAPVATTTPVKVRGAVATLDYTIAPTAGTATVEATSLASTYFVLSGISSTFAATVTVATPATATLKATGSQGTVGDDLITVTTAKKYVVQHGTDWYGVTADGTLAEKKTNPALVVADVATLSGTTITGLVNGETYDVYLFFDSTGIQSGNAIPGQQANGALNAIADISHLAGGSTYKLAANAGAASPTSTIYLLLGGAITTENRDPAQIADTNTFAKAGMSYALSNTTHDSAKLEWKKGDSFVKFTAVGASTATTVTLTSAS